jgi:hypothetical protein
MPQGLNISYGTGGRIVADASERDLPPCPKCGAGRGDPCRTPGDRTTDPHASRGVTFEYGFYDSDPEGEHRYDRENEAGRNQTHPIIWWYVFGMPHTSPKSAIRTGSKSTWGSPIIVRRRKGESAWEHVQESADVVTPKEPS